MSLRRTSLLAVALLCLGLRLLVPCFVAPTRASSRVALRAEAESKEAAWLLEKSFIFFGEERESMEKVVV